MRYVFILDHNVLYAAIRGSNQAVLLVASIAKNCHHRLGLTWKLRNEYWKILGRIKTGSTKYPVPPMLIPTVSALLHNSAKCCDVVEKPVDQDQVIHHRKDAFLALIAAQVGNDAVIVTDDKRTKENIQAGQAMKAVSVRDAVALANEPAA